MWALQRVLNGPVLKEGRGLLEALLDVDDWLANSVAHAVGRVDRTL